MSFFTELKQLFTFNENAPPAKIGGAMTWLLKTIFFTTKDRAEFYRNVKILTQGGVSVQTILRMLKDLNFRYNPNNVSFRMILGDILWSMGNGLTYEQSIAKWIPYQEYSLLESSHGNVREGSEIMAVFSEHMSSVQGALIGALTYPTIMFVVLLAVLVGFAFFVMPSLYQLTDPKGWPESAALLDVLTTFIRQHSIILWVALGAIFTFIIWSMNNFRVMAVRDWLDKIPPWSIYKRYQATVFLICLSGLIKTGSSYNNAVQFITKTASPYLNVFLHRMLNNLARGSNFGESLDVGLFKGNMIVNTSIFALTNRLDTGVKLLAEEGLSKQSTDIVNQGKMLGYIMMSVVALTIGWIVLAVYSIQATLG